MYYIKIVIFSFTKTYYFNGIFEHISTELQFINIFLFVFVTAFSQ